MTDDVIDLKRHSKGECPPKKVLTASMEIDFEEVVVMGWDKNNQLFFATSTGSSMEINWLLDVVKRQLLSLTDVHD